MYRGLACSYHVSQMVDVGGLQMESQGWYSHGDRCSEPGGWDGYFPSWAGPHKVSPLCGEESWLVVRPPGHSLAAQASTTLPIFSEFCPGPWRAWSEVICSPGFPRDIQGPRGGDTPDQSLGFPGNPA